jgi:YidC/Oxa1 family membrane protein insertase
MIVQQSIMMPPPTDEQQASQQKMMKYMTIFFGLMFYKVAAGLCIYFIVTSVWGFCERKLIPKKQASAAEPEQRRGRFSQWMLDRMASIRDNVSGAESTTATPSTNGATANTGREKKDKSKKAHRKAAPANEDGFFHKLRVMWDKVLKEARKK